MQRFQVRGGPAASFARTGPRRERQTAKPLGWAHLRRSLPRPEALPADTSSHHSLDLCRWHGALSEELHSMSDHRQYGGRQSARSGSLRDRQARLTDERSERVVCPLGGRGGRAARGIGAGRGQRASHSTGDQSGWAFARHADRERAVECEPTVDVGSGGKCDAQGSRPETVCQVLRKRWQLAHPALPLGPIRKQQRDPLARAAWLDGRQCVERPRVVSERKKPEERLGGRRDDLTTQDPIRRLLETK